MQVPLPPHKNSSMLEYCQTTFFNSTANVHYDPIKCFGWMFLIRIVTGLLRLSPVDYKRLLLFLTLPFLTRGELLFGFWLTETATACSYLNPPPPPPAPPPPPRQLICAPGALNLFCGPSSRHAELRDPADFHAATSARPRCVTKEDVPAVSTLTLL